MNSRFRLLASLVCLASAASAFRAEPDPAASHHEAADTGWVDLLAGGTLDDWVRRGGMASFRIQDGMIVGTTAPEPGGLNTFL